jgi:hypothetical protein
LHGSLGGGHKPYAKEMNPCILGECDLIMFREREMVRLIRLSIRFRLWSHWSTRMIRLIRLSISFMSSTYKIYRRRKKVKIRLAEDKPDEKENKNKSRIDRHKKP